MSVKCQCPAAWYGVVPPVCPVHNPAHPTTTANGTAVGYGTWTSGAGWLCNETSGSLAAAFGAQTLTAGSRISDEDVERIAQRVAKILKDE